ncbi:hypothetical protein CHS0354_041255 [Potamilus streckersoni]|uniref:Sec20 C-terminal domain-containing protein n=1 Tax=Potamilus streckersoni TaxID=2493646 RepID=A0AAE0SDQ9_9BIVA|nr:hypothetical protein CHS0354_041255 [Potamilus streckersoni]
MAANDIHVRLCLQEIVKLDLEVKALIQDIRDDVQTNEELDEVNVKIRKKLNSLRIKIEELERLGREQDREEDRSVILKNVENHRERLTSNTTSLRKTNIAVKLAIDKWEKDELFSGNTPRKRNINSKESLTKAASSITESLMELNQTMESQVQQGEQTMKVLLTSSNTISDTQDELKSMGSHIHTSKNLLTKYGRREMTDKLLILIALVFFFSSVLYVMKRRLWPG